MPYAIIRGANGRRHEVDFGDAPVRVEIYASEETVEIFIDADFEALAEERRRFAILNIPRHLFSEATAAAARRATNPRLHPRRDFRIRHQRWPGGLALSCPRLTATSEQTPPSFPKGTPD